MKITFLLPLLFLVFSCSSPVPPPAAVKPATTSADSAAGLVSGKADTVNFSLGKVAVLHDEAALNLQLPYTRLISTDSSKTYLVLAMYQGKKVGFELRMPEGNLTRAELISIGEPSDNFLRLWAETHKLEVDKAAHFADTVKLDCLSMGGKVDSSRKDARGNYVMIELNKLFFESNDPTWEAECYLNISLSDHWVELDDTDSDYPPKIMRDLSGPR